MKGYLQLALIILVAITLRIFIPLNKVFADGFINFVGPDSYYHAENMKNILLSFPVVAEGTPYLYDLFVVLLTCLITCGHPTLAVLERVALFIPPFLASMTILLVFIIGRALYSRTVGLVAALFLAIAPGEFMGRTILGCIDHHAAEVFLTTGAAIFVIFAIIHRPVSIKRICLYAGISILCLIAYKDTWVGISILLSRGPAAISTITLSTTTEAVPLIESSNYWPMLDGLLACVGIVAFIRAKRWWVMSPWLVAMLAATIWQVRFDYYLAVPLSISMGVLFGRYMPEPVRKECLNPSPS